MTTTFALVVTTFFAGSKLNRYLRTFVTILYLAACVLVYIRWNAAGALVQQIAALAQVETAKLPLAAGAGIVGMFVFYIGTLGACGFTLFHHSFTGTGRKDV